MQLHSDASVFGVGSRRDESGTEPRQPTLSEPRSGWEDEIALKLLSLHDLPLGWDGISGRADTLGYSQFRSHTVRASL